MTAPRQNDADRWAIAKTIGGAIVTVFTGLLVVFGSQVISAMSLIPSMQRDIVRLEGSLTDTQREVRDGTKDRYMGADARREHDKLEEAIKENQQRIRMLEAR